MKEFDILGSQNILTPPCIFSGVKTPTPMMLIYAPGICVDSADCRYF